MSTVPKIIGNDAELGNFILGGDAGGRRDTCDRAARALLREFQGASDSAPYTATTSPYTRSVWPYNQVPLADDDDETTPVGYRPSVATARTGDNSYAWGRKYLSSNGGCAYIDMSHLEVCIPEVRSALDYLAYWKAMLGLVRERRIAAQAKLDAAAKPDAGQRLVVMANNSDGLGNSYGNHLNFTMARKAFDDLIYRKPHYQLFLASYQASSIIITGQGKVGAENGKAPVPYQLSQRADFFEALTSLCTTSHRGIINTRDEALCGNEDDTLARLHCIFYDANLMDVANVLKVGVMQIILTMIEAGHLDLTFDALLDDAVDAVWRWSHDPTLSATVPAISGREVTALDVQWQLFAAAKRCVDGGACEGIVPDAPMILALWEDTLTKLAARDWPALVGRLDWVMKMALIQRATAQRPDDQWAVTAKHIDHQYSCLDDDGLYLAYERAGAVERLVTDAQIAAAMHEPPADTRAWTRAMLLRTAGDRVVSCDWDEVCVRLGDYTSKTIYLDSPLAMGKDECAPCFTEGGTVEATVEALAERFPNACATRTKAWSASSYGYGTTYGRGYYERYDDEYGGWSE
jgi:hypothetical protein